jgi:gluconokinase
MRAFVLLGVSGSGKSTVGIHAAARLSWPYLDGDDFHPVENIEKMSHGIAFSDAHPWIDALSRAINNQMRPFVIVACSARTRLVLHRLEEAVQRPLTFIHLRATPEVLAHRLNGRSPCRSRDLQTALQTPFGALEIDADDTINVVTALVIAQMRILVGAHHPLT